MADIAENMQSSWPLSAAQKGIWLGQQLNPNSSLYNTAECMEISGDLDLVLFERSLRQMVTEAETLNLQFGIAGNEPIQYVEPNLIWTIQHLDLSAEDNPRQAAWKWMKQDLKRKNVNLSAEAVFSHTLIRVASNGYFWYQRIHHIAIDGYGSSLLVQRVAKIYTVLSWGQRVPPTPFASLQAVIEEDVAYQNSEQKKSDRTYWLNDLENAPDPISLSDRIAPASNTSLRHSRTLPPEIFEHLQAVAPQMESAWPDLLLAVTAVYLHRVTGSRDLNLGLPMMGRLRSVALRVPAMVMNIVPLRVFISPDIRFSELVEQIRQRLCAMRPHSRYRYEQLRRDLKRVGGERRLFGPIVNIMPFDYGLRFGDMPVTVHNVSAGPVEDLAINIRTQADSQTLRIELEGNPDCYSTEDLTQHQENWLAGLYSALKNPDQVISSTTHLLTEPNTTGVNELQGNIIKGESIASPPRSVLDRFIEQASLRPHAEAIVSSDVSVSYRELLALARNLGSRLVSANVKPGQIIAIYLPRSSEAIVAILGVLFSGAAYLILDIAAPPARNTNLLKDAKPALLITRTEHLPHSIANLPPQILLDRLEHFPVTKPLSAPKEDELAYMVYTSGSTGQPKGVMIDSQALASFVSGALQQYRIQPKDRILQFASLHFDASVEEIFLSLCSGATLVLREESMIQSIPRFLQACQQKQITILDLPTAFWHELAFCLSHQQATLPTSLRMVLIGGEAAHPERIKQWHSVVGDTVALLNTYGPSETTVVATVATLEPGCTDQGDVPIGRPLPGVDIAIVDTAGYPTPVGQQGELCILGPTLAQGYWQQPVLTADRFVSLEQFSGNFRAYRTGDQVFVRPDGQLVFMGRLDAEFKISGHRINPAEIESVLSAMPDIREVAVVGYCLPEGVKRLCAYLVAEKPYPSIQALRQHLIKILPAAVIPAGFNFIDVLPKTSSGKVDRAALRNCLPQWVTQRNLASSSSLEAVILRTWEEILGQQGLSVQDDFFELGGQSLQTIQVTNWLSARLDHEISISTVFRYPTAASLAAALELEMQSNIDNHSTSTGSNTSKTLFSSLFPIIKGKQPLFCVHPAAGISWCYMSLSKYLGFQCPLYGLQSPYLSSEIPTPGSLTKNSWAQMIDKYLIMIRQVQTEGSYRLLGWSFGGIIAQAMATRLQQQGDDVELLILLDAYPGHKMKRRNRPSKQEVMALLYQATGQKYLAPSQASQEKENTLSQRHRGDLSSQIDSSRLNNLLEITQYNIQMARQSPIPDLYQGNLLFFTADHGRTDTALMHSVWEPFVTGSIKNHSLDATHGQLLTGEYSKTIAQVIASHIRRD